MKGILLMFSLIVTFQLFSQNSVTGVVVNTANEPLEDVLVQLDNTNILTHTNQEGMYTIQVPDAGNNSLTFTFKEYKTVSVDVNQEVINIVMMLDESYIFQLSLEQLMNIDVESVSKKKEKQNYAPANIQVITSEEIKNNGYTSLMDVFDDLPGFDLVKPYGSDYFYNYMRGFRSYTGSYYLILLNGISFENLWFQDDKIIPVLPLSNVERIEVIYGPSSSMYGINALMGVVNVVTRKNISKLESVSFHGNLTSGFNSINIADFNLMTQNGNLKTSITARFENNNVNDLVDNNQYEWTKDKYLTDKTLWGNVVDHPVLGGGFSSQTNNQAFDVRLGYLNAELGFQYFKLDAGQGLYSVNDRTRSQTRFGREELSIYLKNKKIIIDDYLNATTLLRLRNSNVLSDNPFIYAWNDGSGGGRKMNISLYQSLNSSWSFIQDFEINPMESLEILAGMQFEQKNLQRDYDVVAGPVVGIDSFDVADYEYPLPIAKVYNYTNRFMQSEAGAYLQTKYKMLDNVHLVLGGRYNYNSEFGDATVYRGAFVGQFKYLNLKLLYGEGLQAPPPRVLYGTWEFQGKNSTLKPIKARTTEFNVLYNRGNLLAGVNGYYIISNNTILQTTNGGAQNIGLKQVLGSDVLLKFNINQVSFIRNMQFWLKYGFCMAQGKESPGEEVDEFIWGTLGDIAPHKLYAGVNLLLTDQFNVNIRGRYISRREAFYSNPVGMIDDYFTLDGNLSYKNIYGTGIGLSLSVTNITDEVYFHPGVGAADAGVTPGYWDNGIWKGSEGYYSSLLVQPHRLFLLSVSYQF